jgi:cytoskeletal protein RodZ
MKEIWDCLFSHYGLAYATGLIIFLLTLLLVSKRVIGFVMTLLLLIFALLASLAVANSDTIKNYFNHLQERSSTHSSTYQTTPDKTTQTSTTTTTEKTQTSAPTETKSDKILNQFQNAYEDLKTFFEEQKENVEHYMQSKETQGAKEAKPSEPSR